MLLDERLREGHRRQLTLTRRPLPTSEDPIVTFDVPNNLAQQSDGELQRHALTWARLAAERTLTLDERVDLGIRVRVALQQSAPGAAAADARFILWSEAFGVSVEDVDMAIDRWTRRANSC